MRRRDERCVSETSVAVDTFSSGYCATDWLLVYTYKVNGYLTGAVVALLMGVSGDICSHFDFEFEC